MTNENRFVVEGVIASVLVAAAVWLSMSLLVETPSPCQEGRTCLTEAIGLIPVTQLRDSPNAKAYAAAVRARRVEAGGTVEESSTDPAAHTCGSNSSRNRRKCAAESRSISAIGPRNRAHEGVAEALVAD
ncbi:MAG: hypothetical protein WA989_17505 [Henriciella sp.]|uniref:hypothetical protein n=1 Tax=Henriciella sp. TaxID=1968823 RepID=UPI003C7153FF